LNLNVDAKAQTAKCIQINNDILRQAFNSFSEYKIV